MLLVRNLVLILNFKIMNVLLKKESLNESASQTQVINQKNRIIDDDGRIIDRCGWLSEGYNVPIALWYKLAFYKSGVGQDIILRHTLLEDIAMFASIVEFAEGVPSCCLPTVMPMIDGTVEVEKNCDGCSCESECSDMTLAYVLSKSAFRRKLADLDAYIEFELTAEQKSEMEIEFKRIERLAEDKGLFQPAPWIIVTPVDTVKSSVLYSMVQFAFLRKLDKLLIPNEEEERYDWDAQDKMQRLPEVIEKLTTADVCNIIGTIKPYSGDVKIQLDINGDDFHAVLGMTEPLFWSMVKNEKND